MPRQSSVFADTALLIHRHNDVKGYPGRFVRKILGMGIGHLAFGFSKRRCVFPATGYSLKLYGYGKFDERIALVIQQLNILE